MSEKLRLCKRSHHYKLYLIYPDSGKQYYLLHSSKHSQNGILIQYTEQTREDGTKLKIPHPITY